MAKGDTKTNQYLDIAANGTRADLPSDTCCETRSQTLIREVAERIMDVEDEVERLENNPDVADIVATYADLQAYDTTQLTDKDVIRVLQDETHDGDSTYYRWSTSTNTWTYIGESKQYTDFVGTDGTTAGTAGLVPAPAITDAGKFLKADGTWDTAGGGGGVIELTDSDANINFPSWDDTDPSRFNAVATWKLPKGVYTKSSNMTIPLYVARFQSVGAGCILTTSSPGDWGSSVFVVQADHDNTDGYSGAKWYTVGTTGVLSANGFISVPTDNLTSTSTKSALSANQGKVLKDLVDSLAIRGAGAPTTSTAGQVGTLYEDTTNGKLYICTDATNPYVWEEVGSGGGGGSPYNVYSTKTTSNRGNGGAIYLGSLNASQTQQIDPTATDNHYKYFWALPYSNSAIPSTNSVIIGSEANNNVTNSIAIGFNTSITASSSVGIGAYYVRGTEGVAIGLGSQINGTGEIAIGKDATISSSNAFGAIALGYGSSATRAGEMNIGASNSSFGFNNTNYRLISGVHDGQSANDAVNVSQVNSVIDAINTALNTSIPHIGA